MHERVLIVEDDPSIRESLGLALSESGLRVTTAGDGIEALELFRQTSIDVVLLDVMLPSMDGIDVCRRIRESSNVPIIMLTARSDTADVVVGLEAGADDYITKPFEMTELFARLRAALRRSTDAELSDRLRCGSLEIDSSGAKAFKDGEELTLTATEFRLLYELIKTPGRLQSRRELLDRVWGYDYLGDSRLVDMAVQRLRRKVEKDPTDPELIVTVRGMGYRMETG
ncbi:MAG: response regulator [Actinomycetota bacterium]